MRRAIHTAVAAAATPGIRRILPALLADAGVELVRMSADGASAWEALINLRPDLLVADMELPGMDGGSLAWRAACTSALPARPAALVLCWPEFSPPIQAELESVGAVFLKKPLSSEAFRGAVDQLRGAKPMFLPAELARAEALLDALGVPAHAGRGCLKYAALICARDERARHALAKRVYPAAGELCGLTAAQAERAMRHAIGLAWRSDKFENQYRIFADTVDAARGQPTCGEMISRLADILRSEG